MIGVGEESLEGILQRAGGTPPAWLTALRKQLPVERLSTVTYVNVKKLVAQFGPLAGPKALDAMAAAGLGNVTSFSAVSGLDGDGIVTRMLVGIEGEPAGLLSIAAGKPLSAADLAPIPRDANFAVAARVDAARVLETALQIAGKIEPQAPEEFNANLKQARAATGRGPPPGRARVAGRRVVRLQFVGRGRADRDGADGRGPGEGLRPTLGRAGQALGRGQGGPGTGRRAAAGNGGSHEARPR